MIRNIAQPRSQTNNPSYSVYYNTLLPLVVLNATLLCGAVVGFAGYLAVAFILGALL